MKNFVIAIVVIGIIGGGAWFVKNREVVAPVVENTIPTTSVSNETSTPVDTSTSSTSVNKVKTFAMSEVATHKDATSCWTVIRDKVYDVTTWIDKHPGGSKAILSTCGVDGTAGFTGKHGGKEKPEAKLDSFYIGDLAK